MGGRERVREFRREGVREFGCACACGYGGDVRDCVRAWGGGRRGGSTWAHARTHTRGHGQEDFESVTENGWRCEAGGGVGERGFEGLMRQQLGLYVQRQISSSSEQRGASEGAGGEGQRQSDRMTARDSK